MKRDKNNPNSEIRNGLHETFHENGQPKKKETTTTERETVSGSGSIKTVN